MSDLDYAEDDIFPETGPSRTPTTAHPAVELPPELRELLAARTHRRVVGALPPQLTGLKIRSALHVTQQELAQRLGVTQARVSRIERHADPRIGLLRDYIEALGGELHLLARFETQDFRLAPWRPAAL